MAEGSSWRTASSLTNEQDGKIKEERRGKTLKIVWNSKEKIRTRKTVLIDRTTRKVQSRTGTAESIKIATEIDRVVNEGCSSEGKIKVRNILTRTKGQAWKWNERCS